MNAKMIVCALPYHADHVLLVKYRDMPDHQKGWFVPHVMLNEGEHPEAAAKRALAQQFGLTQPNLTFSHFESFTGNDKSWHLIFHFKAALPSRDDAKPSDDLAASEWFAKDKLPATSEIAHHGWAADIVEKCLAER